MTHEISEDDFFDRYRPTKNAAVDPAEGPDCRPFGGTMFETYGRELEAVQNADPRNVWTWIEGGEGSAIVAGFHSVNRLGYFITEVPFDDEQQSVPLEGVPADEAPCAGEA